MFKDAYWILHCVKLIFHNEVKYEYALSMSQIYMCVQYGATMLAIFSHWCWTLNNQHCRICCLLM